LVLSYQRFAEIGHAVACVGHAALSLLCWYRPSKQGIPDVSSIYCRVHFEGLAWGLGFCVLLVLPMAKETLSSSTLRIANKAQGEASPLSVQHVCCGCVGWGWGLDLYVDPVPVLSQGCVAPNVCVCVLCNCVILWLQHLLLGLLLELLPLGARGLAGKHWGRCVCLTQGACSPLFAAPLGACRAGFSMSSGACGGLQRVACIQVQIRAFLVVWV
jgi:hypothetical protein